MGIGAEADSERPLFVRLPQGTFVRWGWSNRSTPGAGSPSWHIPTDDANCLSMDDWAEVCAVVHAVKTQGAPATDLDAVMQVSRAAPAWQIAIDEAQGSCGVGALCASAVDEVARMMRL